MKFKGVRSKISTGFGRFRNRHFHENKINMDDYEKMRYPNVDVKRAVIDKMLADKLNDVFKILDQLEEKTTKVKST